MTEKISIERLRELLHYDRATGVFTWRVARARKTRAGTVAGSVGKDGDVYIVVERRQYVARQLAYAWVNGRWPTRLVAHVNGNQQDLRWRNLEERTLSQHQRRQLRAHRNNRLGVLGVSRLPHGRYGARYLGKWLGTFDTTAQASRAYKAAQSEDQRVAR